MTTSSFHEQGSTQHLKLRISSDSPSALKVTLENKHPDQTFTLLTWNTPLDTQALNIGAVTLEEVKTGEAVSGPNMKINRMMPPPRDALVEVRPQSSITREVKLDFPWIPKDGKSYRALTPGPWKAVWAKSAAEVMDKEIEEMTGDSHLSKDIHSESAEIQLKV
ncbi:hypothetical protein E4T38_08430 [Aureobasidium subglaciale]|nr:hypothetical protein E4T38_08430 [Aureobasidium subglaciale]KAI5215494.1 hypothetical protein E4T40_08380 [Aureobasidium subglaciale]KAI5218662.1 hypothetical protein E4T41_08245 [Aureobasidium subglaciale]KAI5256216.1 hypothetical protein E4T46_08280 [Aureobasidium subglaciale]